MLKKTLAASVAIVVGALTLTGCGDGESTSGMDHSGMSSSPPSSSPTEGADFNDADVTFATDMIPHHRQAVEMATLAETRASSQDVKDLAADIKAAQDPEIATMTEWLTSWGKPVPADMGGHDMSGSMPGMMSMDEMSMMEDASGPDFDRMFLEMMIEHHEGAVDMARTEQAEGRNEAAKALAKTIEEAQTAEIETMNGLLG